MSQRIGVEHNVGGNVATAPLINNLAKAYLLGAEQSEKIERASWLRKSGRACLAALKQSEACRPVMPEAMCLQGIYEWLRGKPAAARRWWQKSLVEAERMGLRYDAGMAHFEMGKRLNERAHLEKAEAIFAEIGAEWDLARAREALGKNKGR